MTKTLQHQEPLMPRIMNQAAFELWIKPWPIYVLVALSIGIILRTESELGFLVGLTSCALALVTIPLIFTKPVVRNRMAIAAAGLLTSLLVAWSLDAHTELGVLTLAGNRWAVLVITLLAGFLGAVMRTRWWLMLQSGIWCLAIAGSGWWLFARRGSSAYLDEWRSYLLPKEHEGLLSQSTWKTFGMDDALSLSIAFAVLIGMSAYLGLVLGHSLTIGGDLVEFSVSAIVAIPAFLIALVFPNEYLLMATVIMLLPAAAFAGAFTRTNRRMLLISASVAIGALTREALTAAWGGLIGWWGPLTCEWLSFTCRPAERTITLFALVISLFVAAEIGYLLGESIRSGGRWFAKKHQNRAERLLA